MFVANPKTVSLGIESLHTSEDHLISFGRNEERDSAVRVCRGGASFPSITTNYHYFAYHLRARPRVRSPVLNNAAVNVKRKKGERETKKTAEIERSVVSAA